MKMKNFIGHKCKIEIRRDVPLFYTGTIIDIDNNIITFEDREGKVYSYNTSLISEIHTTE
jgi:hypothetical protein